MSERLITIRRVKAVLCEILQMELLLNYLKWAKKGRIKSAVKAFSPGDYNNGVGTDRIRNLEIMITLTLYQFHN